MIKKIAFLLVVSFALVGLSHADGHIKRGKQLSAKCVACHGPDGNSPVGQWPKIAGQHEKYLIKQMVEFQKGAKGHRNNPVMLGMMAGLSKQDIDDLAAYYAVQMGTYSSADPALVELGQQIYRAGKPETGVGACMACHGPRGLGNPQAAFPALSGQHAEYTTAQLKAYKSSHRSNDLNEIMRTVAKGMTNKEIKAVSSYIAGLY